jgi:hypothetical protein
MAQRAKKGSGGAAAAKGGAAPPTNRTPRPLRFTRWTAIWGGAGVVTAAVGFVLLAREAIEVAPFFLLAAFLVFFPLALIK